ncbi:hypothetical protein ACHAXA_003793 [Cyclostephanos tholiformis]|uniref:WW domain-containing protein n=1 Tax=Cyclostephanos tholiformis TaxID=382380 RepID=A0ABD3R766_9STRA
MTKSRRRGDDDHDADRRHRRRYHRGSRRHRGVNSDDSPRAKPPRGGCLLLMAAAMYSAFLYPPPASTAWSWTPSSSSSSSSSSLCGHLGGGLSRGRPHPAVVVSATSTAPSRLMANNAAFASGPSSSSSSSSEPPPLAVEGDWAAYPDEASGEVYYFNHDTGESSWDPPTPTFPVVVATSSSRGGGGSGGKFGGAPPGMEAAGNVGTETVSSTTTAPWGGDDGYDVAGPAMITDDDAPMRGDDPPPMGGSFGRRRQQQQWRRPPTFYETLRVSPMATRSQIKMAYQSLVRAFDQRNDGEGRRSREFNDVARAYMVLSDERTRERYDRQLKMEEAQRRMRYKMMEEERKWREEERISAMRMGVGMGMGMGMGMDDPEAMMRRQMEDDRMMAMRMDMGMGMGMGMGVDDANAMIRRQQVMGRVRPQEGNKFAKDAMYRNDNEALEEGVGTNRFDSRGWQKQPMGVGPPPLGEQSFGAPRSSEIDVGMIHQKMQMQAQEEADSMMAAMEAEQEEERRRTRRREKEERARELSALEEEQAARDARERNQREERRRASSERDVIQDQGRPGGAKSRQNAVVPQQQRRPMSQEQQPAIARTAGSPPAQDMNAMMANMKRNFSRSKIEEAARVKDQLSSLGGTAAPVNEQQTTSDVGRRRSLLFPGKGGIVVEDSPFVARDILLDQLLGRAGTADSGKPSFISWVEPDDERVGEVESPPSVGAGGGGVVDPVRSEPGGRVQPPPASTISGEREREQERLQNIKSRVGVGRRPLQQQPIMSSDQQKFGPSSTVQQPTKTSSKAREQERLQGMKARGFGGRGGQIPVGPSSAGAERTTLGTDDPFAKSSSKEREQRRLQNLKATGGGVVGQQPAGSKSADIRELEEWHRVELAELKREMEESAARRLEEEIVNIAKIHAAEIIKLRDDFEASRAEAMRGVQQQIANSSVARRQSATEVEAALQQLKLNQSAERDRMTEEIKLQLEKSYADKISKMEAAHKAEMNKIRSESGGDDEAMTRLQTEIEKLKVAHLSEVERMSTKHDRDMQQLRNELEAKSVDLTKAHQAEIQKLKQDQKASSVADTLKFQELAMDKLGARHRQEVQSMVAQHEGEMEKLRQALEDKSVQDAKVKVKAATKAIATQHRADMDKMAAQHRQEMQSVVQDELQKLKQQHAKEMEAALDEKRRLQQQAENVTRTIKIADQQGITMTKSERIELILQSFEGVYDPNLISQLRQDLKAQEMELSKQIAESAKKILALQSRIESSSNAEERLTNEIRTLTQWRQSAETELQRIKQGTAEKTAEVLNLNQSIQSMTKEILDLKAQLDRLTQARDSSNKEILELRKWKKNAEAERKRLEMDLQSKDSIISKLKYDFNERDEDVNILVPEVARLQELAATLEDLNAKRLKEFEGLKMEAERLKTEYERGSKSAADTAQSLKSQLSMEQLNNSKLIVMLQNDIKAKENEMSMLQSTAAERSKTIAAMKFKLETYRNESEKVIDDNKKKIESLTLDFENQLARGKAAHQAELSDLKKKLQSDMQRLQSELTSRSNMITDLKTKLDASFASNKQLAGEIVGFNTARRTSDLLLKQSSQNLDVTKQEVERLKRLIQETQQVDAYNTARIGVLERELADKSATLNRLEAEASQFASEREQLLDNLNQLKIWKDTAQATINSISNELALNATSSETTQRQEGKINEVIEKLSFIRIGLQQKDVQLNDVKASTDSLLKGQQGTVYSPGSAIQNRLPPAGTFTGTATSQGANVIGGEFNTRQKNVASVREKNFISNPRSLGGNVYPLRMESILPVVAPPRTATAKSKPSNTMSAYDAALSAMQKGRASTSAATSTSMSGGDAYQINQYSRGGNSTPEAQQNEYAKNQYRKAEKQLLLEAKTLAQTAARSFEEAQALKDGRDKVLYRETLARANEERVRVDHLLAAANEMKEKAAKGSIGP